MYRVDYYLENHNLSTNTIYLEITNKCNLSCSYCFNSSSISSQDFFGLSKLKSLLIQMKEVNINYIIISGGEPLLHPHFLEIIKLIFDYDIKTTLITNGTLLNEEVVNVLIECNVKVKISVDSSKNSYSKNTNSLPFHLLTRLSDRLSFSTVILNQNIDDLLSLVEFSTHCGGLGIEINIAKLSTEDDNTNEIYNQFSEKLKAIILYKLSNNIDINGQHISVPIKNYLYLGGICVLDCSIYKQIRIDTKGNVFPCPFFTEKKFALGNINYSSLPIILSVNAKTSQYHKLVNDKHAYCDACKIVDFCKGGCLFDALNDRRRKMICSLNQDIYMYIDGLFKGGQNV